MRHFGQTDFSEAMSYRKRREKRKQEEKNASQASEFDGSIDMTKDPFIKISPVDLRYFPRVEGGDGDEQAPEAFFVYCPDHKSDLSSKVLSHVSVVMSLVSLSLFSLVSCMYLSARVSLLSVSSFSLHFVSV